MGMRGRCGAGAIAMGRFRAGVRVADVGVAVIRMVVVRMRLMQCGGPGLRLIAVRHPMLRTGLNSRARSESDEEGRDDGVRIHPDAYSSFTRDADARSRTVSSHTRT